jgi:hypothetical protein
LKTGFSKPSSPLKRSQPAKKFRNDSTGSEFDVSDIEHMLEQCIDVRSKLSDWEKEFIDNLEEQFESTTNLSEKQLNKLERIYAEKTS